MTAFNRCGFALILGAIHISVLTSTTTFAFSPTAAIVPQRALSFVPRTLSESLAPMMTVKHNVLCTDRQVAPQSPTDDFASHHALQQMPNTFAGMVEKAMIERFVDDDGDTSAIARVLESWNLLDRDYVHNEYVGGNLRNPVASKCYQRCHSYVPGLTAREFWNQNDFPWCSKLKAKYKAIRNEFQSVTADPDALVKSGNNIWLGALSEDANSYGEGWSTLVLMNRGVWDPINVNLFPVTAKAVYDADVPAVEVFFASMKPHTEIKPHSDFTNFVLTSHLAIDIPYSGENKCRLTVGDTEKQWINGEIILFDTSIMHDAVNESDHVRYILMMRVWHPELSETERQALQFTYNALEVPQLVSVDNPQERLIAERAVKAARAFPEIKRGTVRNPGFGNGASAGPKKTNKRRG